MKPHDDTEQRAEPDTSIEPEPYPDNEPATTSARRVVNVASHTGVAAAGAASVIAAQRVAGSSGPEHTVESLDVFTDAQHESIDTQPRGLSAAAELIEPSPIVPETSPAFGPDIVDVLEPPLPGAPAAPAAPIERATSALHGGDAPEAGVTFIPPTVEAVIDIDETANIDDAPADDAIDEPDRGTALAEAEVDIGGGFVPDDDAGHLEVFGAAGEVGAFDSDDAGPEDDDDGDLASAP